MKHISILLLLPLIACAAPKPIASHAKADTTKAAVKIGCNKESIVVPGTTVFDTVNVNGNWGILKSWRVKETVVCDIDTSKAN